jgi:hypothetical protein
MLQHIRMQGDFTFEVYGQDGKLKSSTRSPNFITSTGLCYPSQFAFADCFRFLSLGSGTGFNTIQPSVNNGWGTTGLSQPLTGFTYIGSRSGFAIDSTMYESEACGYREQSNQLILTRAWRIPTGGSAFTKPWTFKEFMLSPGRPGSSDGGCHCNENGPDCGDAALYYINPKICNATAAFTRIIKDIPVLQDDFLIVTYDLSLSFDTGIKTVALSITNTKGGTNWSGTFRGYTDIVHHGLKLINNGNTFNVNAPFGSRQQTSTYDFTNDYGESYFPSWGSPLEPTCPEANLAAYLSTDDVQFAFNSYSGGAINSGLYFPFNSSGSKVYSSGVMSWHSTPSLEAAVSFPDRYFEIRRDSSKPYYPVPTDFTTESSADSFGFTVASAVHSRISHTALNSFTPSGRSRSASYGVQFLGNIVDPSFLSQPVRSFVMAYFDANSPYYVPFVDLVFADNVTNNPVLTRHTGSFPATYDLPSSSFFFLEDGGDLTFGIDMLWSSPCSSGVSGC